MTANVENWLPAGPLDRLANRSIVAITIGEIELILVRDGERIYACERACPHEQADLCLGHIKEGRLHCPRHLASFGLEDGHITSGWPSRDLTLYPLRVADDLIWINIAAAAR